MEDDNALNGPSKQAPWITFNGVNHGDSQVESIQDLNFILKIQTNYKNLPESKMRFNLNGEKNQCYLPIFYYITQF